MNITLIQEVNGRVKIHVEMWHPIKGEWFHIDQTFIDDTPVAYYTNGEKEVCSIQKEKP